MKLPASRRTAPFCRISRQAPRRHPILRTASLIVLALSLSSGIRASDSPALLPAPDEPLPPDILSVTVVAEDDQETTVEINLKSSANGDVELSVPEGAVPAVAGLPPQATLRVPKNSPSRVDRYRCDLSHGQYRRLSFRAVVKNAGGEIVAEVTKVLELNKDKKPKPAPGLERVPVVIETSDGRKIVEYMTRAEAARRGLTPAAQPDPSPPAQGPTTDKDERED